MKLNGTKFKLHVRPTRYDGKIQRTRVLNASKWICFSSFFRFIFLSWGVGGDSHGNCNANSDTKPVQSWKKRRRRRRREKKNLLYHDSANGWTQFMHTNKRIVDCRWWIEMPFEISCISVFSHFWLGQPTGGVWMYIWFFVFILLCKCIAQIEHKLQKIITHPKPKPKKGISKRKLRVELRNNRKSIYFVRCVGFENCECRLRAAAGPA